MGDLSYTDRTHVLVFDTQGMQILHVLRERLSCDALRYQYSNAQRVKSSLFFIASRKIFAIFLNFKSTDIKVLLFNQHKQGIAI